MKEWVKKFFKRVPESNERKRWEALQVWGALDALGEKAHLRDVLFKKLDKSKASDELKEWKHYDDMGDTFSIDILEDQKKQLVLKLTSGSHYFKLVTKSPYDIDPVVTEGRTDLGTEFPVETKESRLKFAFYFSKFVYYHWHQANSQDLSSK